MRTSTAPLGHGVAHAPDGEPLHYRLYGEGEPLLILNGLVSSGDHWPFFIEHFQHHGRVVYWDYRGHGGAPAPRDLRSVTIPQFAADAHSVCQAAADRPVIVCGLSFGVQVALELWRTHPAEVRALILICGTYGHPLNRLTDAAWLRAGAARVLRAFGGLGPLARAALLLARTPLPAAVAYATGGARPDLCPRAVLDGLFAHVSRLDPRVFGEICASYVEHSALDVLPTITVPTLFIAADRDELTPVSLAEFMHALTPGSRLEVFEGHSHLVQVERPDAVHAVISSFLAEHGLMGARTGRAARAPRGGPA